MMAITFALPAESSGFLRLLERKESKSVDRVEVVYGQIHGKHVAVLHTGVGEKSCRARIERFLHDQSFESLLSAGFAGGLNEKLRVGDLLLAENFSDFQMVQSAVEVLPAETHVDKLFTARVLIDSSSERQEIGCSSGAVAVDMETEFIAAACKARALPMIAIRVITDTPSQPFPVSPDVLFDLARQKTDLGKLLSYLAKHPLAIPGLVSFAGRIAKARRKLTEALDRLLRQENIEHPTSNAKKL